MNLTPERWQRVAELFALVKDLSPPEMGPYLRGECGEDHELENEVLSLVEYHRSGVDLPGVNRVLLDDLFADESVARNFTPGSTFGPYTIQGFVGSGGMGAVYLAEDARLGRKVALKLLPDWLNGEQRIVSRFTREAVAASALNHPNVPVVYEAGEIDGRHFIASEYVEGIPLTERIKQGKIPWREAVAFALQVAKALEASHAAGIVHRDVKPGNILIRTGDHRVKLVDFGIAKLAEEVERQARERTALTAYGAVIGTPGYMAPEQAAGQQVDGRSDIWSLAAVLHEMVTGRPPIAGSTEVRSRPNLPSPLAHVLERALQPDPEKRYPTVTGFADDLERAQRGLGIAAPARLFGISAVVALPGIVAFLLLHRQRPPEPGFRLGQIVRLTTSGSVSDAILSPDSRYVIYSVRESGRESLRLHQVDTGADFERVPFMEGAYTGLTFAPDGSYFYYTFDAHADVRSLYQAAVLPGIAPRKIIEDIDTPASISQDGRRMAFLRGNPARGIVELRVAQATGSEDRVLTTNPLSRPLSDYGVAWSQDGKQIYFGEYDEHLKVGLASIDVADGRRRMLSPREWSWIGKISLLSDGQTLVFPASPPESKLPGLVQFSTASRSWKAIVPDSASYERASSAGTDIVAVQRGRLSSVWTAPSGEPSAMRQITPPAGRFDEVVWSPDGTLVSNVEDGGIENLWKLAIDGSPQQITHGSFVDVFPTISADGRSIAFTSNRSGGWSVWTVDANGSGMRQLSRDHLWDRSPSFMPDGSILFTHLADAHFQIWRISGSDGSEARVLRSFARSPVPTADGKKIACEILDSKTGVWQVAVVDMASFSVLGIYPGIPADTRIKWLPGEDALTYLKDGNGLSNIWKTSIVNGSEQVVTHFKEGKMFSFDWSPNARSLAMVRGIDASDVVLIRRAQ